MANREPLPDKIAIDMTPMIDCVFQLITFFMLTIKTVIPEGDFDIRMPLGASAGAAPEDPPMILRVKMTAGPDGELAAISMNGTGVGDFQALRQKIIGLPGGVENTEVELDCDYGLKYSNVVQAITAVSGAPQPDGTVVELVKKIKFTPPKKPG